MLGFFVNVMIEKNINVFNLFDILYILIINKMII